MAQQSKLSKRLFHIAYSLGAAVVIIGALGKIQHISIFGIPAGLLLTIGLVVEAVIFTLSAFEPIDEGLDWSKIYPELDGNNNKLDADVSDEAKSMLSEKLDNMLKEAKLDVGLMESLKGSIVNFKGAAEQIQPAVDSIAATNKYSEQLSLAAAQLESLNNMYKVQLESTNRQAQANEDIAKNAAQLKSQMEAMAANMENLNSVYGGMLSAMTRK